MELARFDPGREVDTLQSEVNRVFDAFFGGNATAPTRRWVPAMDLAETEDELILRADLPGLGRDDVALEVKDGTLTVSGERKAEHDEQTEGFYRVERAFGSFSRSLSMPRGVDPDAVTADFADGVLEVLIPKPEERKPRRVEIAAGSRDREAAATER